MGKFGDASKGVGCVIDSLQEGGFGAHGCECSSLTNVLQQDCLITHVSQTISERVKELRAAREWSQAQLAEKAKVSNGAVGNIEAGSREGSASTVIAIARALDVQVEWLVLGEGPKTRGEPTPGPPPTLSDALDILGEAVAVEMPEQKRAEAADLMAMLVRWRGAESYRRMILDLLTGLDPHPPTQTGGSSASQADNNVTTHPVHDVRVFSMRGKEPPKSGQTGKTAAAPAAKRADKDRSST